MTPTCKRLGILAVALLMPFTASAATPAHVHDATPNATTLTGATPATSHGLVTIAPQQKTIKVAGRRGRGLALGIIAGVATAAILSRAAKGRHYRYYDRPYYRYRSRRHRCDRWLDRCDYGSRRACRKFYRYCDHY